MRWYLYQIPLLASFNTAHTQLAVREGAIVEIYTDGGITGVGEIAPLPEFTGEMMQDILHFLPRIVEHMRHESLAEVQAMLYNKLYMLPGPIIYGIETALLDAQGQLEGRSLSSLLAQRSNENNFTIRPEIPVNTVIGTMSIDATLERAHAAVEAGFRCIKLKVGRDAEHEVERVKAVRAMIGPEMALRLDANEGWTREQARYVLTRCADLKIQYVEQPLPRDDHEGMHMLRRTASVPIAVDEALSDLASARRVVETGAADVFIVKPQLSGGLHGAQRMLSLAAEHGIRCVITSSVEAGIGVAAALHLAATSPEVTGACGLGTLPLLKNDLIAHALPISRGSMKVPTGPGLGVRLDRNALAMFSIPIHRVKEA